MPISCRLSLVRLAPVVLLIVATSRAYDPFCNVSSCITFTNGDGSTTVAVAPSYQPYNACMVAANGITAFRCRCTLRIRDCLYDPNFGNCSYQYDDAYGACSQFVLWQDAGCSATLCDAAGYDANIATILILLLASLASSMLL